MRVAGAVVSSVAVVFIHNYTVYMQSCRIDLSLHALQASNTKAKTRNACLTSLRHSSAAAATGRADLRCTQVAGGCLDPMHVAFVSSPHFFALSFYFIVCDWGLGVCSLRYLVVYGEALTPKNPNPRAVPNCMFPSHCFFLLLWVFLNCRTTYQR